MNLRTYLEIAAPVVTSRKPEHVGNSATSQRGQSIPGSYAPGGLHSTWNNLIVSYAKRENNGRFLSDLKFRDVSPLHVVDVEDVGSVLALVSGRLEFEYSALRNWLQLQLSPYVEQAVLC